MNRRLFLVSATAALQTDALAIPSSASSALVFYDRRYAASRRFASERIRQGAAGCAIQPDALSVWRALKPMRSRQGLRVDGMTTYSDFIVLQDCARVAGLKLAQCEMHDGRARAETTLFSWRFA